MPHPCNFKVALTFANIGGRSVDIVCLQARATDLIVYKVKVKVNKLFDISKERNHILLSTLLSMIYRVPSREHPDVRNLVSRLVNKNIVDNY
jgi:hypothetical protein